QLVSRFRDDNWRVGFLYGLLRLAVKASNQPLGVIVWPTDLLAADDTPGTHRGSTTCVQRRTTRRQIAF
ncbi:hypothetical protein Q604_UNBC02322G0001, partial [human gut metagenome]